MTAHARACLTCLSGPSISTPSSCQPNSNSYHISSKSKQSSSLHQPTSRDFHPGLMNPSPYKEQTPSIHPSTAVECESFGLLSLDNIDGLPATHHNEHINTPSTPLSPSVPAKRGRGRPRKIRPPDAPEGPEKKKGKGVRPPKKRALDTAPSKSEHSKRQKTAEDLDVAGSLTSRHPRVQVVLRQ